MVGLCSSEGPICPEVSLDLDGDACVDVEWFARSFLSSVSWGVPSRRTLPQSKYSEKDSIRVLEEYAVRNVEWTHGKSPCSTGDPWSAVGGGRSFFENPVITTLELLDRDWGPHRSTFPKCGWAYATVLGKARGVRSHEDRKGWDLVSKFQGAGQGVFDVMIVVVQGTLLVAWGDAFGRVVGLYWLVLPKKVGQPSDHDSPCHGRRVKAIGPLPRPLQGDALSSQLLVASLKLGAGLREFLLKLWRVYKYFICLSNLLVIDPDVREVNHGGCARREWCPKAVNKQASKASGNEPEPSKKSPVESSRYADPNFNLVGVRMRALWRDLGVSTFPWDA
ncbi:hypothetical protein CRG98_013296 [Punica granatum]|uniref:Uncharacterized protein n=1 Tax=Punica granatum TaxID=22663 RepID=A0A2I0KCS3_PUNGR|nr:hypothetical protein CRG98_013296 [Punica granatum]